MNSSPPVCPICLAPARELALRQRLMNRHDVSYYRCASCGLLQTEVPYWLDEAYATPIADTDTGILVRNQANARLLDVLIRHAFDRSARFVDIAGGYGLLTRLLRDRGYDCWTNDKYTQNLFAQGFESFEGMSAGAVFAFEVLEHLHDPLAFLGEQFERFGCRNLVLSTLTFAEPAPEANWWYYSVDTGQHVSFYQSRTLARMAGHLGCHYTRIDRQWHVFSEAPMNALLREALQRPRWRARLENWCFAHPVRPALTWTDHLEARRRLRCEEDSALPPSS